MAHRTTLNLKSKEQHNKLVELAAELGFMATHGAGAGNIGSVSALNQAIADGRVTVIKNETHQDKDND